MERKYVGFILEDNAVIANLLKIFFSDQYNIFVYSNVSDFLDAFDNTPDFVICDGSLPDGTGPEAVGMVRGWHINPVVIIYHGGTAKIPEGFKWKGIFTKPTRFSEIGDAIREAL